MIERIELAAAKMRQHYRGELTPEELKRYRMRAFRYFAAREHEAYYEITGMKWRRKLAERWWELACREIRPHMTGREARTAVWLLAHSLTEGERYAHAGRIRIKPPAHA